MEEPAGLSGKDLVKNISSRKAVQVAWCGWVTFTLYFTVTFDSLLPE